MECSKFCLTRASPIVWLNNCVPKLDQVDMSEIKRRTLPISADFSHSEEFSFGRSYMIIWDCMGLHWCSYIGVVRLV